MVNGCIAWAAGAVSCRRGGVTVLTPARGGACYHPAMPTLRPLAALLLATLAHAAAAAPVTAIIWRGASKTPEEAAQAVKEWEAVAELAGQVAVLPQGFPKVVRSETVQGLRPGYHAVLLGVCAEPQGAAVLSLLKGIDGDLYGRAVEGQAEACPQLEREAKVSGPVQVTAGEKNRLTVSVLVGRYGYGYAVAALRDAAGKVLERRVLAEGCRDLELVRVDKKRLRVSGTCERPGCTTPDIYALRWTIEAEEAIAAKERGELVEKGECDQ